MKTKYIWYDGDWVDVALFKRAPQVGPMIIRDTPEYRSPIDGRLIDGRSARREDLKRNQCREVDPGEFKPVYRNPRFAKKHGLELGGDQITPHRLPTTIGPGN
jgi:hypothetical protein